jgi:uncharacterized protein YpiB (UPF0302 family)
MKRNTSYGNYMKEKAQEKQKKAEQYFLSLTARLVLDESFQTQKKERLNNAIDEALKQGDRDTFFALAAEYNNLPK